MWEQGQGKGNSREAAECLSQGSEWLLSTGVAGAVVRTSQAVVSP